VTSRNDVSSQVDGGSINEENNRSAIRATQLKASKPNKSLLLLETGELVCMQ